MPYRHGSETHRYLPDFIVLVDDWHGDGDPLHLVAEITGYPRGGATGVDNLDTFGHWRSPR